MRTLLIEPPETCMRDSSCTNASSHRRDRDTIRQASRPANLVCNAFVTNSDERDFATREERAQVRLRPPREGASLRHGLRHGAPGACPRVACDENERSA